MHPAPSRDPPQHAKLLLHAGAREWLILQYPRRDEDERRCGADELYICSQDNASARQHRLEGTAVPDRVPCVLGSAHRRRVHTALVAASFGDLCWVWP